MVALVATCGPGNTYVNRPFEGTKTVRLGFLSRILFVRSLQLPKTEQPFLPLSDAPGAGEKQSVQGSRQSLLHGFKPVKTEGGPVLTGSKIRLHKILIGIHVRNIHLTRPIRKPTPSRSV